MRKLTSGKNGPWQDFGVLGTVRHFFHSSQRNARVITAMRVRDEVQFGGSYREWESNNRMCPSQTLPGDDHGWLVAIDVGADDYQMLYRAETKSEASKPLAREVGCCDWAVAARIGCRKRKRLAPVARCSSTSKRVKMCANQHTSYPESRIRERAGGKQCFQFAAWGGAGELSEAASGVQGDQKGDKPRGKPKHL